jgi:hypothetical protein
VDSGTLSATFYGALCITPAGKHMKTRHTSLALGMNSHIYFRHHNSSSTRYSKILSLGNLKQDKNRTVQYRIFRHLILIILLISDEPEDYDEIADEGITMDYANRVLNADDDMDTGRLSSTTSSAGSSARSIRPVSSTLT